MTRSNLAILACFAFQAACFSIASAADPVIAVLKTNKGDIKLELDADKAPITVANFVAYAKDGQYDNTIFHRVIPDFMLQGGGLTKDLQEKSTKPPIKNESSNGLKNEKYTVAMARTSAADSATCQFFINTTQNDFLDQAKARDGVGYAVFGKVIEGKEVVDAIAKVKTSRKGPHEAVPVEPITIEKVEIVAKQ